MERKRRPIFYNRKKHEISRTHNEETGREKIDRQMRQEKSTHKRPTSLCKSMTEQALGEIEKRQNLVRAKIYRNVWVAMIANVPKGYGA